MRNHASQMLNGAQDKRISMLIINSLPTFRALVSKKSSKKCTDPFPYDFGWSDFLFRKAAIGLPYRMKGKDHAIYSRRESN